MQKPREQQRSQAPHRPPPPSDILPCRFLTNNKHDSSEELITSVMSVTMLQLCDVPAAEHPLFAATQFERVCVINGVVLLVLWLSWWLAVVCLAGWRGHLYSNKDIKGTISL